MKIAISIDGENVSAHFGRCPEYAIVEIENNKVLKKEIVKNPGHQTGLIPEFLNKQGINYIVTGGMGRRALDFFKQFEIEPIVGITGKVDEVIEKFIKGELKSNESLCQPRAGKGYGIDKIECSSNNKG